MARMPPVLHSPRLLRFVAATLLSLVLLFACHVDVAAAANCDVNPLVVPLAQRNDVSGVDLQLAEQEFQLPISIIDNATVIPSPESCRDYYSAYGFRFQSTCDERFGPGLTSDNGSSGATGEQKMVANLPGLNIEVKDYGVVVLRQKSNEYNLTGVGLGLGSTFIEALYDGKHIPSQSFSLGYNKGNWSKGIDSLVLGGYDSSKVDGQRYEFQIASDGAFNIEVTNLTLKWPDKAPIELLENNSSFVATLDTRIERLVVPSTVAANFKAAVSGYTYSDVAQLPNPWLPAEYGQLLGTLKQPDCDLTITLSNGFSVTIPSDQLTTSYTTTVEAKVDISSIVEAPANTVTGIFGSIFLSQAYLAVDHESMKFTLSKRANSTATAQLESIGCTSSSTPNPPTIVSGNSEDEGARPGSSRTNKKVLGPILGSLLAAIAILALSLFLLKRYKRKKASVTGFPGPRPRGLPREEDTKTLAYQSIISQPSWGEEVESFRGPPREKVVPVPLHLPAAPSRVSLVPSRSGTPVRNSYFTEELDISRP